MIKLSGKWCVAIALSVLVQASYCLADDPAAAAKAAAGAVLQKFGSSDAIRQNASLPLTSGAKQLSTIDGSAAATVQISHPSSTAFLTISAQPAATRDLNSVLVRQDLDFDNTFDYSFQPPFPISGICANGVISCDAGTWHNCRTYSWTSDSAGRANLAAIPMDSLAGCYCVNKSCGSPGNMPDMLKYLGGGVVAVVQERKSGYAVARVELTDSTISYYGRDNSGSPTGAMPQAAYFNQPSTMTATAHAEAATQSADPDSFYTMVTVNHAQKGVPSDEHTCTVSRSVPVREVNLPDIIVPVGGTGSMQMCGANCIRLVLGRPGDNYWEGNCTIYEENYRVKVNEPDFIVKANLAQAIWDDYLQVWIGGVKVYNGPDGNFPPETDGTCELGTSWNMGLDRDVTAYFKQAGVVDTKIRVSVAGRGEGYAFVDVQVKNSCSALDDVINDNCQALAADNSCQLQDETVDGVRTWQSFNPTGNNPLPDTRSISASGTCSQNITRDWWLKKRTYRCTRNTKYDFTDAGRRVDTITRSVDGNQPSRTTFAYTDARKDQETGNWTVDNQTVTIPDLDPPPDCEPVCRTRKPVEDSQAGLTGVSTAYRNSPISYDTFYHVCDLDNTCPAGPGEVIVDDCKCLNEFKEATAAMLVLDEAGHDMTCADGETTDTANCPDEIRIFTGRGSECLENGWSTSYFNCCNDAAGGLLFVKEHCPDESLDTVQAIRKGRTHYIGKYCKKSMEFIGCVQSADMYCVFNTKLARVIHEQGRLQLRAFNPNGNWGPARSPNCRGFTPEEFQMLDFSKIDLTEVFGDITPTPALQVQNKTSSAVNNIQN